MAFGHTDLRLLLPALLFPILSAILAAGQSDCNINLGLNLSAGRNSTPWLSPSEDFAFGFWALPPSADDSNDQVLYLLAIWFNKVAGENIVWSKNDHPWFNKVAGENIVWSKNDHPVLEGSRIQLTNEGLILYDSQNNETWRAETGDQTPTCAAMLDSGNFVLRNGDPSSSKPIWESFSFPTDTILPGQTMSRGGNLTSRQSETNYIDGRFQLRMQEDGNLVLYTIFLPTEVVSAPYWASGTLHANNTLVSQLVFDEADGGYVYIQRDNRTVYNVMRGESGSRQDFYYMARLDYDGVFRLYNHPKPTADAGKCASLWSTVQDIPQDICSIGPASLGPGACGYNSYCQSTSGRRQCHCPEGYSFLDPRDRSRGCRPDFPLPSCQQDGWETKPEFVEFKELDQTDWPLTDYELQTGSHVDKDTCKEYCRLDCFCAAAIHNGNNCWKKRFPLSNGRKSKDVNRTALVKVPRKDVTSSGPVRKDQSTIVIVMSALLGSSVFFNILLLIAIAVASFTISHMKLLNLRSASTVNGMRKYTYKELEEATGGFKQHLGRGSFGTVYKGVLPSIPGRYIAIKRLDKVEKEGEKEFKTEVSAIGRTHHKNLVTLLGYCDEGIHRLLVYEYMSNGSLAGLLFGLSRPHWNRRMQIAFGIARGLTYLHEECSTQIIHCDVKPQNILLDEYLMPKISDFGMAKLLLSEQSRAARSHIRGTIGYFAPEWFRKASITVKVDVYSFGVMLLEIICCMSSVEFGMGDQEEALIDWVYDCYSKRKLNKLVENDEEARNDTKSVERLVMVAIWCIQEDPSLRPSMRRVTQMLEGVAEVSVPPRPSGFSSS